MHSDFVGRTWGPGTDISPAQTDFATSMRIPFLTSAHPRWPYITGIVVGDHWPNQGSVPTEAEVRQVAEWVNRYSDRCYGNSGFRDDMRIFAPYDVDGTARSVYFIKHPNGGWAYRERTWTNIPWAPSPREAVMTLEEVIDRIGF